MVVNVFSSFNEVAAMTNRTENLRPEVKTLVEMGNGVGGTKVSAPDRATIKENLLRAFAISKVRSQRHARVAH